MHALKYSLFCVQPGDDIRQSLLDGCDQGLGQTFQDALTFFMDFEDMLQQLMRRRPQSASVLQVYMCSVCFGPIESNIKCNWIAIN
jgi:hypothetical protein